MIRLHKRTLPVRVAGREICDQLWTFMVDHDLSYPDALIAVLQYQGALLLGMVGQPAPPRGILGPMLDALQRKHKLTDVEMLRCLVEHQDTLTRYMLRMERHPSKPDKKADEA